MFDLDAYFARIGYAGSCDASLDTLRALHALHPAAIPFENLDPLLGRPVLLGLDAVQEKLVRRRRGGYCFEQNALFRAALETLGFTVTGLAARVLWMAPPERPLSPRTHMLLKLDVAGETYIADVGFGGLLQDAPLRLLADAEQSTPTESMRYVRAGDAFKLQARLPVGWHDIYMFTLEPQVAADYVLGNWFTSTHPESRFRTSLLVERLLPDVRISLVNRKLTHRRRDGQVSQRMIESADELDRILVNEIGLDLPANAKAIFDRLPAL